MGVAVVAQCIKNIRDRVIEIRDTVSISQGKMPREGTGRRRGKESRPILLTCTPTPMLSRVSGRFTRYPRSTLPW